MKPKRRLDAYDNVYFLGYKTYQEAPMYIQQFNIGIIPHTKVDFSSSTNPMKMYEYLACGKPVVATQDAGTENVENMIAIASSFEDFNLKVNELLESDSKELQRQRQDYVKKYSWISTVDKMIDLLHKKIN
jgi:glycosyltransferase involved in cell wall biosynthesis